MSFRRMTVAVAIGLFALYALLVLSLAGRCEGGPLLRALGSARTLYAVKLSLGAGTAATALSMLVAIPAAYALSRYAFPGKRLVDTLLELPVIVSPVALGAMLLVFFSSSLGEALRAHGIDVVFEIPGIVLAQFVATAGLATRLVRAVLDEIPLRYEAVARSLGASPVRAFATVTLPLAGRGILAAGILSWAKAIGEFGATITLAGAMAMKTETLPTAIFMALSAADIPQAVALILILVGLGVSVLYVVRILSAGHDRARAQ